METETIGIEAIGFVEGAKGDLSAGPGYDAVSTIRILPRYEAGLSGVEGFSHFFVIYHQHEADKWMRQRHWPEGTLSVPPPDPRAGSGIFTIRAPCRPGRLGSSVVELVRREGPLLFVRGLDAVNGTPVLDFKVYIPAFDSFPSARVPDGWKAGMQARYSAPDTSKS
ncbi:MAG TPA: TrmO family methyltransferase [Opitutales bacterium]|nr:TrmO family methyltransferase [Opitutales bacterium]